MRKTRRQLRSIIEWAVAAGLLAGVAALGLNLIGEIRRVTPVVQVIASESEAPVPPSSVPSRAVSVPLIAFAGNVSVQVGELAADVLARLKNSAVAEGAAVDRGPNGDRTTRAFGLDGRTFYLVSESTASDAAPRITGIFLP